MPDPLPKFNQSIIASNSTIIVGLSGGPDSIYLLHQLNNLKIQLNLKIIAVHLNHEWQESAEFAARLCQDSCDVLGIPLIVKKLSELKFEAKWNGSQEEIGRKMRRHLFETIAHEYQACAIALAHHRQDQHETFFIRLIRGSSLQGLVGMQEIEGLYIRPMLAVKKDEIITYLKTNNIDYYTDPTNVSDDYLRNKIRNHVIPQLQKTDIRFEQNLDATMDHLAQVHDFLNHHVTEIVSHIRFEDGLKIEPFLQLHSIIQQKILLSMLIEQKVIFTPSQKLFKEIMRFLEKSSQNKHTILPTCCIIKNKSYFSMKKTEKVDKNL